MSTLCLRVHCVNEYIELNEYIVPNGYIVTNEYIVLNEYITWGIFAIACNRSLVHFKVN